MKTKRELILLLLSELKKNSYPENYLTPLLSYIGISVMDVNLEEYVTETQVLAFETISTDLQSQKPVEYTTGKAVFFGNEFHVSPRVLIPRVDTEPLVEQTLLLLKKIHGTVTILDIGTGSGALIISIALALRASKGYDFWATDISPEALVVAKQNAKDLLSEDACPIRFFQCDVVPEVYPDTDHVFIITNPPYISEKAMERLPASVKEFEPHIALREQKTFLPAIQHYCDSLTERSKTVHIAIEYNDSSDCMIQRFASPLTASLQALLAQ